MDTAERLLLTAGSSGGGEDPALRSGVTEAAGVKAGPISKGPPAGSRTAEAMAVDGHWGKQLRRSHKRSLTSGIGSAEGP